MKKTAWLAATLFVCLVTAGRAQTSMLREWPAVGNWATVLLSTPQRGPMCSMFAKGSLDAVVNIILTKNTTHLYLNFGRASPPANLPRAVLLSVDGRAIYSSPILSAAPANGIPSIMADLPGAVLAQTLVPALLHANTMQVDLGDERFTVETRRFSKVFAEMRECSNVAAQMLGTRR